MNDSYTKKPNFYFKRRGMRKWWLINTLSYHKIEKIWMRLMLPYLFLHYILLRIPLGNTNFLYLFILPRRVYKTALNKVLLTLHEIAHSWNCSRSFLKSWLHNIFRNEIHYSTNSCTFTAKSHSVWKNSFKLCKQ